MSTRDRVKSEQGTYRDKNSGLARTVFGMGACYALGTFTDNFYKQCAVLFAATFGMSAMQSYATVLLALPFILFSAWAGWLADVMVKKHIIVLAKVVELVALIFGGYMLVHGVWGGMLVALFFMGLQATFFSPALNGSVPECFPSSQVPRVNSLIKLGSTVAVLGGIAFAGMFLDMRPSSLPAFGFETGEAYGRGIASALLIGMATLGLVIAFFLKKSAASIADKSAWQPFPWLGPAASMKHLHECRKDPALMLVLVAEGYFYGIAAIAAISVTNLAKNLGYTDTVTSLLSAALMIGIAVGGLIAGKQPADSWRRMLVPATLSMGVLLVLTAGAQMLPAHTGGAVLSLANVQLMWLFIVLFLCGIAGGIYLIPLASFIQLRPEPHEKGKVLGASNFLSFVAITVFGMTFFLIGMLPPAITFIAYGVITVAFALYVMRELRYCRESAALSSGSGESQSNTRMPFSLFGSMLSVILSLRYRVRLTGTVALKEKKKGPGILFLPNHPALIDPVLVYSRLAGFHPRPLADAGETKGIIRGLGAKLLHVVAIPDIGRDGKDSSKQVVEALNVVAATLAAGDNVLLYPAGRLYRAAREKVGSNSGVSYILTAVPDVRVVLVRTTGLWGSIFSRAYGVRPNFFGSMLRAFPKLLAHGLFFAPKRAVSIHLSEPDDLPRSMDRKTLNTYLEAYYNAEQEPGEATLAWPWEKKALPHPVDTLSDE